MNIKHEQKRPFLRGEEPTVTLVREVDGVRCRSGQMRVEGYAASIIGTRAEQQDSCVVLTMHPEQANDADTMLAVVCDGIGGFAGGKEASTIAVSSIIEAFQARRKPFADFAKTFEQGICLADKRVVAMAKKARGDKAGTTAVVVYVENNALYWGSVGDSRIYLFRGNELRCLTRDHNYAMTLQEKVLNGQISQAEADADPDRESLISFIGMNDVTHIDASKQGIALLEGDVILLCSDGLYKSLSAAEISDVIRQYAGDPSFLPGVLTATAFDKDKPHQDNTTVIAIICQKDSNKQQEEKKS